MDRLVVGRPLGGRGTVGTTFAGTYCGFPVAVKDLSASSRGAGVERDVLVALAKECAWR